jgi:Ni2+-binding GTPase involved in maturation of urease and hydrogenase
MRTGKPFVFTDIRSGKNIDTIINWIKRNVLLEDHASGPAA